MHRAPWERRSARDLAGASGLPLPMVGKILKRLARGGILASHLGASGGYALVQDLEEISVAAVIRALEGPIALTACVEGSGCHCEVETLCPIRGNWERVNQAIRGALQEVTLEEMAMPQLAFFCRPDLQDMLGLPRRLKGSSRNDGSSRDTCLACLIQGCAK